MHPYVADAGGHIQPEEIEPDWVVGGEEEDAAEHAEEVQDHIPIAQARASVALLTQVHRVVQDEGRGLIGRQLRCVAVALRHSVHHHHQHLERKESKKSQNQGWLQTVPPEQHHRVGRGVSDPVEDFPKVADLVVLSRDNTVNIVENHSGHHKYCCGLRVRGKEVNCDVEQEEPRSCDKLRFVGQDFLKGLWLTEFHIKYIIIQCKLKLDFRLGLPQPSMRRSPFAWQAAPRPAAAPFGWKQLRLLTI